MTTLMMKRTFLLFAFTILILQGDDVSASSSLRKRQEERRARGGKNQIEKNQEERNLGGKGGKGGKGGRGNQNTCEANVQDPKECPYNCHREAMCQRLNLPGKGYNTRINFAWECYCPEGYEGDGYNICEDINECEDGPDYWPCDKNGGGTCINHHPKDTPFCMYECGCKEGYRAVGGGNGHGPTTCANIDECGRANNCHPNASCVDTVGSYECFCEFPFVGDGINRCEQTEQRISQIQIAPPTAGCDPVCNTDEHKECQSGQLKDGSKHYYCDCIEGCISPSGRGGRCMDIENCANNNNDCDKNAKCSEGAANGNMCGYTCKCNSNWFGDGFTCNQCKSNSDCLDHVTDSVCDTSRNVCVCKNGGKKFGNVCCPKNHYLVGDECVEKTKAPVITPVTRKPKPVSTPAPQPLPQPRSLPIPNLKMRMRTMRTKTRMMRTKTWIP